MTAVSYGVSKAVTKLFRFNRRASNFVTAMGVSCFASMLCRI